MIFIERLREALKDGRGRGSKRVVEARDLAEILHHFERLDSEARGHYASYQQRTEHLQRELAAARKVIAVRTCAEIEKGQQ